ncbi:hypothetical protein COY62_02215 [bacterium (Candidatus Howlettbacteria) CG_4_10_14_0_8_um_filter_40_9]|nr:MAG: hypothetical protein COY62_02215 [bacterium (Candidatus Howlettbacteria) CG_4_10_14_0_8_um_filter_40_9]
MTVPPITSGQEKQYKRFVEDAADKALAEVGLDKDGIQKLIENGDEFQADIVASIRQHSVSNQFAEEEVESSYGYLSGYEKPHGITEQTNRLRELFPGIGFADEKIAEGELPSSAEGWFAIPRWESIAPTYGEAVQKVFDKLRETRGGRFHNYREGQLDHGHLRQSKKSVKAWGRWATSKQEGHDILVFPAQFGFLHRGRSVRRALEVMNSREFGLGAFAIGIMLLTHPERLQHFDDLWIDCAGDEFSFFAGGCFEIAPYFSFRGSKLGFDTSGVGSAGGYCGSASAFVPEFGS